MLLFLLGLTSSGEMFLFYFFANSLKPSNIELF